MAQTLYDYYTGQGKALPTVQERAPIYAQQGGQGTYTGTAEQNTFLLGKLQAPASTPTPTVPPTTSITSIQNPQQPVVVPPYTPPQTPVPDLTDLIKQFNTPSAAETTAQNDQNSILSNIQSLLGQQGTEGARTAELQTQAGIPDLQKNLNEINAQIRGINSSAFTATQNAENRLAPTFQIYGEQAQIARQQSAQTFGLAAASAALQDNIALANQNVDRAIQAEFGGIESQINYQKLLLDVNKDRLSDAQKKKADALNIVLDERSRLLEEQKTEKKGIYDIMTTAAQNIKGFTPTSQFPTLNTALQAIQNASTREAAVQIASEAGLLTPTGETKPFQFVSGTENQAGGVFDPNTGTFTARGGVSGGASVPVSGEFADLVTSASNLVGSERGKASKAAISSAIASENWASAYAQVANNVEESLTGTNKTRFGDARTDYAVMQGLRDAVQAYADSGGDMGLLKGKEEEIKRKLGIDSGKASELAVQLWREFQVYRVNMTGAAFSPAESADYAAVNPTLGKSLDLNLSVINGALNGLENRIIQTVESRVPGSKNLYNKVQGINSVDGLSDDEAWQVYQASQK